MVQIIVDSAADLDRLGEGCDDPSDGVFIDRIACQRAIQIHQMQECGPL